MNRSMLTIGLTTYNRRELLAQTARSLRQVRGLNSVDIVILDDGSTECAGDLLRALLPRATLLRNEKNSGRADFAIRQLWAHFVQAGTGYLLSMDSDLLAARSLIEKCRDIIFADFNRTDRSLYSLFNTRKHPVVGASDGFLLKRDVGSAGTLWRHDLLAGVLAHVPPSPSYDWDWSAYLAAQGVPIRVTPTSYLQHIGHVGQNTQTLAGMDHGDDFDGFEGSNLAAYLDQTREGLLQMIAAQNVRLDRQAQAIGKLTQAIQTQGGLLHEVVSEVCAVPHV